MKTLFRMIIALSAMTIGSAIAQTPAPSNSPLSSSPHFNQPSEALVTHSVQNEDTAWQVIGKLLSRTTDGGGTFEAVSELPSTPIGLVSFDDAVFAELEDGSVWRIAANGELVYLGRATSPIELIDGRVCFGDCLDGQESASGKSAPSAPAASSCSASFSTSSVTLAASGAPSQITIFTNCSRVTLLRESGSWVSLDKTTAVAGQRVSISAGRIYTGTMRVAGLALLSPEGTVLAVLRVAQEASGALKATISPNTKIITSKFNQFSLVWIGPGTGTPTNSAFVLYDARTPTVAPYGAVGFTVFSNPGPARITTVQIRSSTGASGFFTVAQQPSGQ